MSLQIWLPLKTDVKNYGLTNIPFINSNATSVTGGKLGNCFNFTQTTGNGIYNQANCAQYMDANINNHSFSFCAWVQSTATDTCVCAFSYGLRFFIGNSIQLSLYNATRTVTCSSSVGTTDGKWHHVAGTYDVDTGALAVYKDGVCVGTATYPSGSTYASSWSNIIEIGRDPNNNTATSHYFYQGKMTDFRAYDHALSKKEVEELSKGLILHWKLSGRVNSADNMLNDTDFNGVAKKFTLTAGTEGGFTFTPWQAVQSTVTYTVSANIRGYANMNLYRLNTGGNEATQWINKSQLSTTEYRHFEVSFVTPSSKTTNQIYICTRYGASEVGDWFEIEPNSLKLECGDHATEWSPSPADMGETGTVEYDCSGNKYDGEIHGSLRYVSGNGRYGASVYFPAVTQFGGNRIRVVMPTLSNDAITMSAWFKTTSIGFNQYHILFCSDSTYREMSLSPDGSFRAGIYAGGTRQVANVNNGSSLFDGKWHHVAITYDGSSIVRYVDGVPHTAEASGTMNGSSMAFCVGTCGDSNSYEASDCYISDVRMYSTALSQEQINELYQISATIDKNGNIFAPQISEN